MTVDEVAGSPSLSLTVGERTRQAVYSSGSNTSGLVFDYRVADGDVDPDGVAVSGDTVELNAGAISDLANNAAVLTIPELPEQPGHRVDGVRPDVVATRPLAVAGSEISIAFGEPLDENSIPAIDAFAVIGLEAGYSVTSVSVRGNSVWLALSPAVPAAETFVAVTYMEPVSPSSPAVRDTAGNAAGSFVSDWLAEAIDPSDGTSRAARKAHVAEKRRIGEVLAKKRLRTPAERKVSSRLLEQRRRVSDPPEPPGEGEIRDDRVKVDIRADVTPEVLARIRELGGKVLDRQPRYRAIRARLSPQAAVALAEMDAVRTIHPADEATTRQEANVGSAFRATTNKANTSEGDTAHRAGSARNTYGVDGSGIGIGVLSDGVKTLADRQASGDLPGARYRLAGAGRVR